MAAASLAVEPSRAREEADRSLTVAAQKRTAYPLWDGKESVARYALRVNLPETQTLDLGNGVALELVLIPAGKFIMGTPEPKDVDEGAFRGKIIIGQALLAAGGGILLVLIGFAILRAIWERRRFQYSLRRWIAMTFAAGLCVLGGMHWWHSERGFEEARAGYIPAVARFKDASSLEDPAHEVTITKPFYIGKYEVTQGQYQQVMGANPSDLKGPNLPVVKISWKDTKEFCRKVNERFSLSAPSANGGEGKWFVRLPNGAEWEYACRAGTTTQYFSGDKESDLARVGWYEANSGGSSHPVGQKEPNAWGTYDMHGNVWEWCEHDFDYGYKGPPSDETATVDLPREIYPVLRGGSWSQWSRECRSACRLGGSVPAGDADIGFRVVLAGPP